MTGIPLKATAIGAGILAVAGFAYFALAAASGDGEWSVRMADEVFVGARYGIAVDGPASTAFTIQATNGTLTAPVEGRTNGDGRWATTMVLMEHSEEHEAQGYVYLRAADEYGNLRPVADKKVWFRNALPPATPTPVPPPTATPPPTPVPPPPTPVPPPTATPPPTPVPTPTAIPTPTPCPCLPPPTPPAVIYAPYPVSCEQWETWRKIAPVLVLGLAAEARDTLDRHGLADKLNPANGGCK